MRTVNRLLSLDRDDMTDLERELFLKDLKRVYDEYFETDGNLSLEVTRSDDGFLICVITAVRRIKNIKKPI